ncbi:hypothetical protein NQ318_014153 [Aromia moschata]|uniref:Uncharacterized protein n=1 Tax=Aromia moschata TaxID=1265417 RepID=A0AAV8X8M0_9CUCU|nr:hypothetical protein NQ318_014153 [Aromia moschata]
MLRSRCNWIFVHGKKTLLKCGLVANETCGWTVEGRVPTQNSTIDCDIDKWQLDVLGIEEPTERKTKMERP